MAIYVRAGVHFVPLEDHPLAAADDTMEVCGVRILGARPLDIWCLYRPPIRTSAADQREDNFDPDRLPSDDATIIVGDFNAHHPLWDSACDTSDATGERVADWLDRAGWTALNSGQPTLLGRQTAPDVAACSTELARRTTWALTEPLGSDHLPMVMKIRNGYSATPRIRKPRWAFKKADWASWTAECEAALAAPPPRETAQELCALFTAVLHKASSPFIPRGSRADPKPWASDPRLEEAVADRRAAQASINPTDPSTIERWREARRRAAEVDSRVSRERFREMASTELNRHSSLGKVTGMLKKWECAADDDHRDGQAMRHDGRLLVKDKVKAEAFCATYAWVSRKIGIPKIDRQAKENLKRLSPPVYRECEGTRQECCGDFSNAELDRQLHGLKLKKTPGPDNISNEMLLHLGPVSTAVLLRAINTSWREGRVPAEWRRASICPIPKAGKDKTSISSYRPIALTSHLAKLAERLVLARLTHAAAERELIPPEQVGFREGRSVEDHLGCLIQQVQDGWQIPAPERRTRQTVIQPSASSSPHSTSPAPMTL